jgi:response regulator of citrate/malate metabolism
MINEYPVLSWHINYCHQTGSQDMLVVHAMMDEMEMCWSVRFTIFDYVSKLVKYQNLSNKLENVE